MLGLFPRGRETLLERGSSWGLGGSSVSLQLLSFAVLTLWGEAADGGGAKAAQQTTSLVLDLKGTPSLPHGSVVTYGR